jgi:hypothetical protein
VKKIFDLLKVFQNDPYFICMYTTRNQLERVGGCVRTMLGPLYCLYETHPGAHAHRLCLRRRSGGLYAAVDSKPTPSGMATAPLPHEHYFFRRKYMPTIFQRHCDEETADHRIQMPQRVLPTTTNQFPLEVLARRLEEYLGDQSYFHERYPWAARFVMGIPVPVWARPLVWNAGQKARFISSIWLGQDLGSYVSNEWCSSGEGSAQLENSDIVLDGQQRLHSLEEYFLDRLAIPDVQGLPRLWSELRNVERKRFLSTIFAHTSVCSGDEQALRKTYDLCAMGVEPRTYDERAAQ